MSSPSHIRPLLVFGYGNPSRGDDALGPLLVERLEAYRDAGRLPRVDLQSDYQLQVEHALDLKDRELVVLVDAASTGPEPFSFEPVLPKKEVGFTTHGMTPGSLLRVYEQLMGEAPPATHFLAIRGYAFELGEPLTGAARENLEKAVGLVLDLSEPIAWN